MDATATLKIAENTKLDLNAGVDRIRYNAMGTHGEKLSIRPVV